MFESESAGLTINTVQPMAYLANFFTPPHPRTPGPVTVSVKKYLRACSPLISTGVGITGLRR
jgi:hypothetical protein